MPGFDQTFQPPGVGRTLAGRYRLVAPIARGGMAEVWEGYDEVLSRPVAVKVLQAHLARDGTFLERFRREAVTAARLAHPGITATFDTGLDQGTAFIVMELVRGRNLRQMLDDRGRLEPWLAVSVARQVADALTYAHQAGLVHRDIKPANVLLVEEEWGGLRVKVTDFGIAKAGVETGADLTRTGMVLGTPKYLSPEQIRGADPDARADLYSLGVVLYEMLVGAPPFVADTDMATALAHLSDKAPRPSSSVRHIPSGLDRVVLDLLAKTPERRISSAAELRARLDGLSLGPGPGRGDHSRRAGRRRNDPGRPAHVPSPGQPPLPARRGPAAVPSHPAGSPLAGSPLAGPPVNGPPLAGPPRPAATGSGPGHPPTGSPTRAGSPPPARGPAAGPTDATTVVGSAPGFSAPPPPPPGRPGDVYRAGSAAPAPLPPAPTPPAGYRADSGPGDSTIVTGTSPTTTFGGRPGSPAPGSDTDQFASAPPGARRRRRAERNAGLVVLGLVVIGAIVAAGLLAGRSHRHGSSGSTGSTGGATPVQRISGVSVFMVNGRPPDNPSQTPLTFDGNPSTYWSTEVYSTPTFGGLYPGIGLEIRLGGTATLHSLSVTSPSQGWSASAYVSRSAVTSPQPISAWGAPTGSAAAVTGSTTLSLGGRKGSYVLLWITNLGPSDQVRIAELSVS